MCDHPKFDYPKVKQAVHDLLIAIGENPDRPGLADTPRRVADFYEQFINHDPGRTDTLFEAPATDQMVIVSGMRVWSLCEHHLLPFWCDISVGYIAEGQVLGLSKFARIAHRHASRLQLQEKLVTDIADEVSALVGANVAVLGQGEHLCMTARGVRTPALMTSSAIRGVFRDSAVRAEFLHLAAERRR